MNSMTTALGSIPRRGVAGGLIVFILLGVAVMLALYFIPLGGSGSGSGSGGSGGGGGSYMQQIGRARDSGFEMHAEQTMQQLVLLAQSYEISNGRYPRDADELYEGVAPMKDPWDEAYEVEFVQGASARDVMLRITSPGKDGMDGTEDDLVAERRLP
ncbi:MAG: hypothetical protein ACTS3F_01890 [Phycisphaerales bacterium]